jgi:ribosome-associated heat shock protein Hsp15
MPRRPSADRPPPGRRGHNGAMESTRVDRWLWAVRVYKTRAAATAACRGGHVEIGGAKAKPASPVRVGDRVSARAGDRERVLEVVGIIDKRVGAPEAAACFVDHSPPPPAREAAPAVPLRDPGAGRPSKRERRMLDRARGRS